MKGIDEKSVKRFSKSMVFHCVRNTFLENLHAGTFPGSKSKDYSDVKVISPFGEINWNDLSRVSDEEMERLMREITNKIYTFLKNPDLMPRLEIILPKPS